MEYLFVIDTDSYAEDFEREMCAYLTNQIGDCEVGDNYIDVDNPIGEEIEDIILQKPNKHGCCRPVTIEVPNVKKHNSVGIYFEEEPTSSQITVMKQRALKFNEIRKIKRSYLPCGNIQILGFRLMTIDTTIKYTEKEL